MILHPREDELNDLVSGALAPAVRARIDRHLAGCASCREDAAELRALVDSLAALPAEVKPSQDLRPGIWRRIDAGDEDRPVATGGSAGRTAHRGVGGPRRPFEGRRSHLAAAALALVAVSTGALLVSLQYDGEGAADTPAAIAMSVAEARFDAAARELQVVLDEQRGTLSPSTREVLDSSLGAIDAAVAEARAALEEDPGNPMLSRMLMAAWEKKLGVLRTASEAPVGI